MRKTITTEEPETPSEEAVGPMVSSSDESCSDKNAGHVRLIVGVLCPLVLVLFVVVGVVCYRKKRDHFDLGMVYESHQDLVHEKEDEEPKYTMLQLRGTAKKTTTFDNIHFTNADSSVHMPLATSDRVDHFSETEDDDLCFADEVGFGDDVPIIENMI